MLRYCFALSAAVASIPSMAAEMTLNIELPRMTVAEYHRPYVATWIEKAGEQSFAGNVAVWYDVKKRDNEGAKWLKDLRSWWRKSGKELQAIPDGVSGATRAPGPQAINLLDAKAVTGLAPGNYEVVVEAARENGGREVVRVPFQWPLAKAASAQSRGEGELGVVALEVMP